MPGVEQPTEDGQVRSASAARRQRLVVAGVTLVALLASAGAVAATIGSPGERQPERPPPDTVASAPPAAASVAPSPTSGPTVSIAAVGDVIMGSTPKLPPDGGATFFDDVKPQLRGDVVMGNFEGALTDEPSSPKCRPPSAPPADPAVPVPTPSPTKDTCFAFRMPPSYAQVLRGGGFHLVSLANNHTRDYGAKGLADTRAALEAAGMQHTGAPGQIAVLTVNSVRVAVVGFSPYGWTQSVVNVDAAAALVRKAQESADIVVVNMHAGAEGADRAHVKPGTEMFLGENRGDPMKFSRAVIDAGADLVVGHSPHVLRGMEWYKGRLIAYSLGNFAGYRTLSTAGPAGIGGILQATLRPDGTWVRGALVSTQMVDGGLPALDPRNRALPLVNDLSAQDFGVTAARLSATGEITPLAG